MTLEFPSVTLGYLAVILVLTLHSMNFEFLPGRSWGILLRPLLLLLLLLVRFLHTFNDDILRTRVVLEVGILGSFHGFFVVRMVLVYLVQFHMVVVLFCTLVLSICFTAGTAAVGLLQFFSEII